MEMLEPIRWIQEIKTGIKRMYHTSRYRALFKIYVWFSILLISLVTICDGFQPSFTLFVDNSVIIFISLLCIKQHNTYKHRMNVAKEDNMT